MASPLPLPSAPPFEIAASSTLQPPLTYRSTGPPLLLLLPPLSSYPPLPSNHRKPIDPPPLQKWAEEGFTVLECRPREEGAAWKSVEECVRKGGEVLLAREEVSVLMMEPSGFGVVCYDEKLRKELMGLMKGEGASRFGVLGLVSFGEVRSLGGDELELPWIEHVQPSKEKAPSRSPDSLGKTFAYMSATSSRFVLPGDVDEYRAQEAGLCHGRSLGLLRKVLGGPEFDLEALWEEHCLYEFGERSVEKTMATMVAEPYVNHVPTLTGGIGRVALTAFYTDHFIFANPDDTQLVTLSRTVGVNTVVDEFIMEFTHDRMMDWLAPGIPPTNVKVRLPMMSVVTLRGDRLSSERIWWDQATLLSQLGLLPSHVPWSSSSSSSSSSSMEEVVRLPVSGLEQAAKLVDEGEGESNEMMGKDWGVSSRK